MGCELRRGVVYVAFGKNYLFQCLHSILSIRRLSDIPVYVLTNVEPRLVWREKPGGVEYVVLSDPDHFNRFYKTSLIQFTPFERTLYLDTDTAVRSKVFEKGFEMLNSYDFLGVCRNERVRSPKELGPPVYKLCHKKFGYEFPLTLVNGGVLFFRKSPSTQKFFSIWNRVWDEMGRGRDMPALAYALQQVKEMKVKLLPLAWNDPKGSIITHAYGQRGAPGIPRIVKFKPSLRDNKWVRVGKGVDLG